MAETLDPRLRNLYPGQYRMWRDSYTNLIPITQSITKPERPEKIQINTTCDGEINYGTFKPPYVEFRNTEKSQDLFDKFNLRTYRENVSNIRDKKWHEDGAINKITLRFLAEFRLGIGDLNSTSLVEFIGDLHHTTEEVFTCGAQQISEYDFHSGLMCEWVPTVSTATFPSYYEIKGGYHLYLAVSSLELVYNGGRFQLTGNTDAKFEVNILEAVIKGYEA